MIPYLLRVLRVHLGPGRALYGLTLGGVALGVASVLCIQILNRNAVGAFAGSMRAVSGEADLTVMGRVNGVDEAALAVVLSDGRVRSAWPVHRVDVVLAAEGAGTLDVVGFDLMSPMVLPWQDSGGDLTEALRGDGWVAVSPELAAEQGWAPGSTFSARRGTRAAELRVGALIDFTAISPAASRRLAVMDIAQAQALFGEPGRISQIDLALVDGAKPDEVARDLDERLGSNVRVVTPAQRRQEAAGLLTAFRFNLTALSLISLLVGLFLVHSSVQAGLVRRRAELGVLRCLGVTRARIIGLVLAEVSVLGVLGVAVGLPLGYLAAAANVDLVSRTLTSIYLLQAIETLEMPAWIWGLAAAVGIGGALAGAVLPAIDVSRRPPRVLLAAYTLHERAAAWAPRLAVAGLVVGAGAVGWYSLAGVGWRPAGFVLGVLLVFALTLFTPFAVREACRHLVVRRFGFAYACRTLVSRLSTTSFAVAALVVAVTMLVGITIMIRSFRTTLEAWIHTTIRADVYVTARTGERPDDGVTLDPSVVRALTLLDEVESVDRLRQVRPFSDGKPVVVSGIDMHLPGDDSRFLLLSGDMDTAMAAARRGAAFISEPLARQRGLQVGDRLDVATLGGTAALAIVGVYADYGNESGAVLIDLARFAELYGPGHPTSIALYLRSTSDAEQVAERVRRQLAGQPLRVRSNRRLRRDVLEIFDQTFAVTAVVQTMSLLIAAAGITLSLLVIARHRIPELALYRALGATRRQIFAVFFGKGIAMGMLGLALGGVGGVLLAVILVHVINPAWFGWTLVLHWPVSAVLREGLVILAAAAVAAVYPALRASATPAAELSRDNVA